MAMKLLEKMFICYQLLSSLEYVKRDAELTMMLACYNDNMVIQIMEFVSMYSGLDYIITCHTGVSKWYASIYDKLIESDELYTTII